MARRWAVCVTYRFRYAIDEVEGNRVTVEEPANAPRWIAMSSPRAGRQIRTERQIRPQARSRTVRPDPGTSTDSRAGPLTTAN